MIPSIELIKKKLLISKVFLFVFIIGILVVCIIAFTNKSISIALIGLSLNSFFIFVSLIIDYKISRCPGCHKYVRDIVSHNSCPYCSIEFREHNEELIKKIKKMTNS